MLTVKDVHKMAVALIGVREEDGKGERELTVPYMNILLQEALYAENSIRAANGDPELSAAPTVSSISDVIPYNDNLVRSAIPYGLAWQYQQEENNLGLASQYRNMFIEGVRRSAAFLLKKQSGRYSSYNNEKKIVPIIENGSITREKLDDDLKTKTDKVPIIEEDVNRLDNETKQIKKNNITNLFNPYFYNQSDNGVTITYDETDKTYSVYGTALANMYPEIGTVTLQPGKYKLLGLSVPGGASTYRINMYTVPDNVMLVQDLGAGRVFELASEKTLRMVLYANAGTAMNFTFKPMITTYLDATIEDYVPYAGSNEKASNNIADLSLELFHSKLTGDKRHNDNVGWIVDVANSWTNHASDIWYSYDGNLFQDEVIQTSGKWPMTCSVFASAVLFGITFEGSKYNGKVANEYVEGAYRDGEYLDRMEDTDTLFTAAKILRYFVDKGYVFHPEKDLSNVEMGDLLFVNFQTTKGQYYYNGDHVCIFAYKNNSYYFVWEVGDDNGPVLHGYPYSFGESHIVFAARPPYPSEQANKRVVRLTSFTAAVSLSSLFNFWKNGTAHMWKVTLLGGAYAAGGANSSIYLLRTNLTGAISSAQALYEGSGTACRKLNGSYEVYDISGAYDQPVTVVVELID